MAGDWSRDDGAASAHGCAALRSTRWAACSAAIEPAPLGQRVAAAPVDRVDREPLQTQVYSLEVPESGDVRHQPAASIVHNCFPKDVQALKQLAGNSGYHFQLLTSVIEVNELQKRRVVGKLEKHLGPLRGPPGGAAGPGVQGQHRRHAGGVQPGAVRPAAGRGRRRWWPTTRWRWPTPAACWTAGSSWPIDAGGGARRRRRRDRDRVGRVPVGWPRRRCAMPWRQPLIVDGRNLLDPASARAAGFALRVGRPAERGRGPRCDRDSSLVGGQRHAAAAADRVAAQADAADRQPAVPGAPDRPSARARRRRA